MKLNSCDQIIKDVPIYIDMVKKYKILKNEFIYKCEGCLFVSNGDESEIYKNGVLIGSIINNKLNIVDECYSVKNNVVSCRGVTLTKLLQQRFNIELHFNNINLNSINKSNFRKYKNDELTLNNKYVVQIIKQEPFNIVKLTQKHFRINSVFYDFDKMEVIGSFYLKTHEVLTNKQLLQAIYSNNKDIINNIGCFNDFNIFNNCLISKNGLIDKNYAFCLHNFYSFEDSIVNGFLKSEGFDIFYKNTHILTCVFRKSYPASYKYVFYTSDKSQIIAEETTLMSTVELIKKYKHIIEKYSKSYHSNGLIRYDGTKYYTKNGFVFDLEESNYEALKHLSDEEIYNLVSNIQILKPTESGSNKRIRES